jgi:flagellin
MGMVVQHNMSAMNANRNLGITATNLSKSTEKLSSGYKINRAGDNAAGLAISEKMRGQIRGLDQASSNAEDGISMIQTAEGALTETHSILQRMRELAVQAASDTNTDDDRTQIQNEIDQLTEEVDRIANTTEFNTKKLLDGSRKGSVSAKDGSASVEGNFSNSTVSASISNNTGDTNFTDAIRFEVKKDFNSLDAAGGSLSAKKADVDKYIELSGKNDTLMVGVKTLQADAANSTGLTDTLINDYVDKTVAALKGGTAGLNADQTTAWTNLTAQTQKMSGTGTAKLGADGTIVIDKNASQADTQKALKDALDQIAKNKVELESNSAYVEIAGADVKKMDGTTTATAGTLISDATTKQVAYDDAKAKVNATNLAGKSAATTAADSYKAAYKAALQKGLTGDAAKEDDAVVKAREDLYSAFDDDLKDATTALSVAVTLDGTALTTSDKLDKVAGAAFDELVKTAEDSASADAEKENAVKQLKGQASDGLAIANDSYEVSDLFEHSKDMKVASNLDEENNLVITLKNGTSEDTKITIANADKLKAGDTLTITAQAKVETTPAKTGNEAFRLQVGANAGQEVSLGINSMKSKDLNIVQTKAGKEGQALDVTTQSGASLAVEAYDMAIQSVSTERAKMGAMQNRLEHTISNLDTSSENLQSAESSLRDTDMAEEMTRYSKNNILQQAGQSMLAQANQSTQGVLNLLG